MTEPANPSPADAANAGDAADATFSLGPKSPRPWLLFGVLGCLGIIAIMVGSVFLTAWYVKRQINPPPIHAVELDAAEQRKLDDKIESLGGEPPAAGATHADDTPAAGLDVPATIEPVRRKSVSITEKELNALLAKNTGLGDHVQLSLGGDTISARSNVPIPDDFPVLGGKTARVNLSLHATLVDHRMVLRISDVTLSGFPIPNAWLGGIKNVDLIEEHANNRALKAFVAGLDEFKIENGAIRLTPAD